jgi:hypothetical protein
VPDNYLCNVVISLINVICKLTGQDGDHQVHKSVRGILTVLREIRGTRALVTVGNNYLDT